MIPERICAYLSAAAGGLRGTAVLHVNTAANSGGVAEILKCQVPLERSLGLDSHWLVMRGNETFFTITKNIHNLLQGQEGELSLHDRGYYLLHNHERASDFASMLSAFKRLVLVIHDPQPLSLIGY